MQLQDFKLERYFARYEFNVRYILCASDCESLTISDLLKLEPAAAEAFQQHWLGYTESLGAPALRQAISQVYTTIQPEQVLVFCGAEEAIFLTMQAVLGPGTHAIVHWPCYQALFEVARSTGAEVSRWTAREENDWALDLDELRGLLRPNTRLIIANLPHNPTGYLMPQEQFRLLNHIAQQAGALLFSDEVYRESEYQLADRLPAACDINPRAISLGVLSKTYGLAGLRIGWIATHDRPLYEKLAALKDYTTICASAPSEFLAALALRHREQVAERNRLILRRNLALLDEFFARHPDRFRWVRPKAGSVAFPKLLGEDIEAFCHRLATQAEVLLLPGTLFEDGGNHFRIGLGRKNMEVALGKIEEG